MLVIAQVISSLLVAVSLFVYLFANFYLTSIVYVIVTVIAVLVVLFFTLSFLTKLKFRELAIFCTLAMVISMPLTIQGLNAYGEMFPMVYYYKIMVEVESVVGTLRGESVVSVKVIRHFNMLLVPSYMRTVSGEAVFLDVGLGQNVVMTLGFGPDGRGRRLENLAECIFQCSVSDAVAMTGKAIERRELQGKDIPMLVTFVDPANPYTGQILPLDAFEAVLGPGYRFKGAWIAMTPRPGGQKTIQKQLPWLHHFDAYPQNQKNGSARALPFSEDLFIMEMNG